MVMLAFTNVIYGQQGIIHGIVKDAQGELPGATIIIKGTTLVQSPMQMAGYSAS